MYIYFSNHIFTYRIAIYQSILILILCGSTYYHVHN